MIVKPTGALNEVKEYKPEKYQHKSSCKYDCCFKYSIILDYESGCSEEDSKNCMIYKNLEKLLK